jgi:hypothetical protein
LLAVCITAVVVPSQAAAADSLQALLARTSDQVSLFLDLLSDTNCSEHVTQLKLGDSGKVVEKQESEYDYLILLSNTGGDLNLVESRLPADPKSKPKEGAALLLSNGFSTLFLIFHTSYSGGFEFSLDGEEAIGGRSFTRVHFQHVRGTPSPAALAVRGREYPLDLVGTAWIDPSSGVISRLDAQLEAGMDDVGLRSMETHVQYAPVSFDATSQAYWLPAQATVEVESLHQHWRNIHVFSSYKRFSVDTKEQIAKP